MVCFAGCSIKVENGGIMKSLGVFKQSLYSSFLYLEVSLYILILFLTRVSHQSFTAGFTMLVNRAASHMFQGAINVDPVVP